MSSAASSGAQARLDRRDEDSGSTIPRVAPGGDGVLLGIAALALILHLVTSGLLKFGYGYFIDEFYYIACSKRLAFGYVDHPPVSIWLLALSRGLIGDSLPALRLIPALAAAGTVFLSGRIARMLGCGKHGQAMAALAVLVAPVYLVIGGYYSMNALELLIWTACTCLLIGILRDDNRKRWLLLGLLVGIGLECKHTMILYVVAFLAGLIMSPSRGVLRDRHFVLGGMVALVLLVPNLAWQVLHGFPSLEFYRNAIILKNAPKSPVDVVMDQVLQMNPLALPLWLAGLWFCFVRDDGRAYRAFGWSFVFLILIMIVSRSSRPDRIVAAYPFLFAAGACMVERWTATKGTRALEQMARAVGTPSGRRTEMTGEARAGGIVPGTQSAGTAGGNATRGSPLAGAAVRSRSWLARAAMPGIAAGGIALAPIATPVLPPSMLVKYMTALGIRFEIERGKSAQLPQWLADRFGWEERAAEVGRVWATLTPEEQEHAVIFAESYGLAGSLEFYGRRYGLHRVVSAHNNYFLWGPGKDPVQVLVGVLVDKERLEEGFDDVRQVGLHECEYCMEYQSRVPIYVARGPRFDLREAWPELKHFE